MGRDFFWGIASYHRPNRQPMLNLLHGMGYERERILLAVQCEEDYKEYTRLYGGMATILFRKGNNISDNKNTILEHLVHECDNAPVVMTSDKVRGIQYLSRDGRLNEITTRREMDSFVHKCFVVTKMTGARVFGCYSVGNKFYMSHTMQFNMLMLGCFMGIIDPSEQAFDNAFPLKEDFEFILRHVAKGERTLRFNDVCIKATLHTRGGCHELWNAEGDSVNADCTRRILARYRGLVKPHATRKNELRYVGPRGTINQSIFDI